MDFSSITAEWSRLLDDLPWEWLLALLAGLHLVIALLAAGHALLYKRDPRSALSWVALCLLFPLAGPILYYLFGINRIRSQAHRLTTHKPAPRLVGHERGSMGHTAAAVPAGLAMEMRPFAQVSGRLTSRPILGGNRLDVLHNGEQAYPAMLAAIAGARRRVLLASYLFEFDMTGKQFVAALSAARERGVEVRVLIDGVGELYSWPRIGRVLRKAGLPMARFLPPRLFPPSLSINLRNHRKILLVDDQEGFTGGMNVGDRHLVEASRQGTSDLHFRVRGPILAQLEEIFINDWTAASDERLSPICLDLPPLPDGDVCCRCISDGPNDDLDKIALTLMGAISAAREEILIINPYFLPSREMIASLQSAALRGVKVCILLPSNNNLPFIHWATRNLLWELLLYDVEIRYQPPPFAHTKLFLVDRHYVQLGSANLDARSLRLNFELNLESFSAGFAVPLAEEAWRLYQQSTPVTLDEVDSRPLPVRLRDAFFWLFLPYL
ncbi:MAG: phospholipase D-like domain-containing protein [Gammaproteobacteria bacterium]|nr:phospholipase D-like domain-containing protein [Gammaproteobacteria bacterium]